MTDDRVQEEKQRLTALLFDCGISERRMKALDPIVDNVSWMRVKLDDTREQIKSSGVAIPYDNGGGQKGIRENPLFKGYQNLFKSYMQGMSQIIDCLPEETATVIDQPDKPKTVLEMVRNRHERKSGTAD